MIFGHGGCVYITTNKERTVLYTGVTSDIVTRIWQHKQKTYIDSFSAKYNCDILVYYQSFPFIEEAISAEKTIKGGSRKKKINLINGQNPDWRDLYNELIDGSGG